MTEKLPCITLNRHAQKRLKDQHPWIFSNEIADMKFFARLDPGAMVDVLDCHGEYVATGFINPKSLIAIRILSRERELVIDEEFFTQKFMRAINLRENIYGKHTPSASTYRAVFGESDGLPGLIVDRFGPVWVMEPHSLGMEMRAEELAPALQRAAEEICGDGALQAIVFRTDSRAASLEGMEVRSAIVGKIPADGVWAVEGGISFPVDPREGQKTGFFFDQRENRNAFCTWIKSTVERKKNPFTVLDVYCHLGAWGLRALEAGATHATFIDQSEAAMNAVRKVAAEKGWEKRCTFLVGDAEKLMAELPVKTFNAIALDPPAFITSKKVAAQGLKAYLQNNILAMKLVRDGGILSTSTCSHHCLEDRFEDLVGAAARATNRDARILWRGGAAWDHPALPSVAETRYLKNLLVAL